MMFILACISCFFLLMQMTNALANFLFSQKLKKEMANPDELVSVLIPARNEERNISVLLAHLIKNKKAMEILVYDDQSTDRTAEMVLDYSKLDSRIQLISGDPLPVGWLGKNHACFQLAKKACGHYYLFLDADVQLFGTIIEDTLAFMKKKNLGLLSIFPKQIQKTWGERLSVPIMNYILLTLLPLVLVRLSPFTSHSAANGQFMLFNASTYHKTEPHEQFKLAPVEDIAIARQSKKQKIKVACVTSEDRVQCRMYQSYKEALNGFSKNIIQFFGNITLFAFAFWILAALGFIPVLIEWPSYLPLYIIGIVFTLLFYSMAAKQNVFFSIVLFPFHLIFILHTLLILKKRKSYLWKDRPIYS